MSGESYLRGLEAERVRLQKRLGDVYEAEKAVCDITPETETILRRLKEIEQEVKGLKELLDRAPR